MRRARCSCGHGDEDVTAVALHLRHLRAYRADRRILRTRDDEREREDEGGEDDAGKDERELRTAAARRRERMSGETQQDRSASAEPREEVAEAKHRVAEHRSCGSSSRSRW